MEALGELAMKTTVMNVGFGVPADNPLKSMAAGYTAAKDLAELQKKVSELEAKTKHKLLDTPLKRLAKIANENEKYRKEVAKQLEIQQGVETRRKSQDAIRKKYFETFDPTANSCRGRRGKIMNKPENEWIKGNKNCNCSSVLENNYECKSAINTNILNKRENEWEFLNGRNDYASAFNSKINTETVFIETENIQKNPSLCKSVINTVVKYRKWILLAVITSVGTYIIFKNRTKIKPFIERIKKICQGPIRIYRKIKNSRVIKFYQRVKNSKLINNRITRPVWIIMRYNMRNPI